MRQALGFILSLCVHAGLVASALIAFPQSRRLTEELMVVPVELVTLAQETNVRAARPEPEPEPEIEPETPAPQPAPEPEPVQPEAEPEIIPPAPQDEPEPEAEPTPPEPEPEP
ncbi:MAG TPA: energy transducer TonB, partial [Oceanicaulis sp.]|nr:energy transducer TonB [Oceanicaulis sp.]